MQKALATFHNGQLDLTTPVDWPEGTWVELNPLVEKFGMTESEWPTTPEGIQFLLRRMDEATAVDDVPVDFDLAWPEEDRFQRQATRNAWDKREEIF